MPKKVDYATFLEFFSHRIIEVGIPVIVTLIFDACLTRFLENKYYSATFDRYFRQVFQTSSTSSSSTGVSIKWAIIIAVVLIAMIVIVTALILLCYYYGCVKLIMGWMVFAVAILLSLYLLIAFKDVPKLINTPFDWIGLILFVIDVAVVGELSIFWRAPTIFTQVYLIIISVLIAVVFLSLPDWTVWVLLVVLIIYDCCVVLCPHGLLNVIIQKSEERGDSIPALVYSTAAWISKVHNSDDENENENENDDEIDENEEEDRNGNNNGTHDENNGSPNSNNSTNNNNNSNANNSNNSDDADDAEIHLADIENPEDKNDIKKKKEYKNNKKNDESNQPLLAPNEPNENDSDGVLSTVQTRTLEDDENDENEEKGEENSKKILTEEERKEKKRRRFESDDEEGIKLGLGDFAFYGILITRAARIGWDVTILCILAVILGLSITLILLAILQRPLPALPFSLFIGIIFYFIGIYTFRPFHENVTQLKITF